MKTLFAVFVSLFVCSSASAKDIQLFNPDILGQPTSTAIKILQDKKPDDIEPVNVLVDIKDGKYNAASVFYPKKVTFAEARESLNKLYKVIENLSLYKESVMSVWRVEDKKFAISIEQEDDHIRIMFIQFQPTKEVFKSILKTMGVDPDDLDNPD
ncbi:MAG: hypothetical protein AABZ25_05605 [Nitrospirota bacterium]